LDPRSRIEVAAYLATPVTSAVHKVKTIICIDLP